MSARQDVCYAADLDDGRGRAAARTFGVEGVDGAAADGANRVFDKPRLVQRVAVDAHLHIQAIGDA